MRKVIILHLFPLIILFSSCQYPILKINEIDKSTLSKETIIKEPVKVYLKDNSVVVFNAGFVLKDKKLNGEGSRYYFNGKANLGQQNFPIDSAIAITTIISDIPASRSVGSFLMGITSVPLSFSGIYCLVCPKCCFGSCPTIYTSLNDKEIKAELFSSSIGKYLKANDLDRIAELKEGRNDFSITVTNEALETHFIDKLKLKAVYHKKGSSVYNNSKGDFVSISNPGNNYDAVNAKGEIITPDLLIDDGVYYRTSNKSEINKNQDNGSFDFVELKIRKRNDVDHIKILFKYRNTLLSTILFYDIVLASQGIKAIDWLNKIDNDEIYSNEFKQVYDIFSGIKLSYYKNGNWIKITNLPDAGPLSWKYLAENIDVSGMGEEIRIRLDFFKDNIMIDYIGIDNDLTPDDFKTVDLTPTKILLNQRDATEEIMNAISDIDEKYLITDPGDKINLNYEIENREDQQITFFIESNGYYKEWIRGNWITNNNSNYIFNLADIQGTIRQLQSSWIENREIIEAEFFRTRVPLKGKMP